MKTKLGNKFENWIAKILYALVVAYHHEDYVTNDVDGTVVYTPASKWHKDALSQSKHR